MGKKGSVQYIEELSDSNKTKRIVYSYQCWMGK